MWRFYRTIGGRAKDKQEEQFTHLAVASPSRPECIADHGATLEVDIVTCYRNDIISWLDRHDSRVKSHAIELSLFLWHMPDDATA